MNKLANILAHHHKPGIMTRGRVAIPIQNRFVLFSWKTEGRTRADTVYSVVSTTSVTNTHRETGPSLYNGLKT
jgi:hypothetical protein